ncbi:MAG: hypothetical protein JXB14_02425 [Candidatus Altiarchaeota archaeon]|nr:hypothetical protein [Candidatus Altiarchaeota archaeon]
MKRDEVIAAPIVGGLVGIFAFFMLYSLAGLDQIKGDFLGVDLGLFISVAAAIIAAAVLFGELLVDALSKK